jgi:hypothetical protein
MVAFRGFNETAEAASAVSMWLLKRIRRFQWDPGSRFHTVSMWLRKRIRWFQWDRGSGFGVFSETMESLKKTSTTLFFLRKVVFSIKLCFKKFGFHCLNETAEGDSAMSMRPRKQIQRSQCDHGSGFWGLNETAESFVTPRKPLRNRISALNSFKGML